MNTPKRILIFSFAYFPDLVGGAEVAVKEITDRVETSDVVFDMIALRGNMKRHEKLDNVNVYRVGWKQKKLRGVMGYAAKLAYIPLALLKALRLYSKNKYDAIWSIMANFSVAPWLFFSYLHPKVPRILTLQEGDPVEHIKRQVRYVYPIFKKVFTRATRIQVISNYLKDMARDFGAKCPIDVIPNGVDLPRFTHDYSSVELDAIREEIQKKPGETILITTSRLVTKNGLSDVIAALEYLPTSVKFLIAGIGSLEESLKEQVTRLGLEDRVKFLGYISHFDLPKYLKVSDIFVRPSLSEGMGNSFIEAMAAQIPVIATPVGGIVDFLIDGETGLMCEVNNPRSIAQKVEKLMKDTESRDYIVRTAYVMVTSKYDWGMIADEMKAKVFNQI